MVYVPPTISGYNSSPPSDDGSQVTSNKVLWSTIKTKLADPVKNYADSMNSAISSAFAQKFLGTVDDEAVSFSVGTTDDGKLFNCTSAITVTLPPASSAGEGFACIVFNNSTGTITVDGDGSETINGSANYLIKNKYCAGLFVCNGTGWFASGLIMQSATDLTLDGNLTIGGNLVITGAFSGSNLTPGTVPYASLASGAIGGTSDILSGTPSKLVNAASISPLYYGCSVYQTAGTSISTSSWTTVLFDTESFDDNSWHSTVTNTSRITVDFTGRVSIDGCVDFNTSANASYGVRLTINGAVIKTFGVDLGSGINKSIIIHDTVSVSSGDYIEIQGFQATGGSITTATGSSKTSLKVNRIK